jgi:hypothetical protein
MMLGGKPTRVEEELEQVVQNKTQYYSIADTRDTPKTYLIQANPDLLSTLAVLMTL